MALYRDSISSLNNYGFAEDEKSSLELFAEAKRRMEEKNRAIKDMQNEYDLLVRQALDIYKSNVQYLKFDSGIINASMDWLNMLEEGKDKEGKKLDKRKKYKEKYTFQYLESYLQTLLGIDCHITKFMIFGYGVEAYEIQFSYLDHEWELFVPNVSNVSRRSFETYGESVFKLKLRYKDSECGWSQFGSTFLEEDLKDIMAVGIDKYCKEDKNANI